MTPYNKSYRYSESSSCEVSIYIYLYSYDTNGGHEIFGQFEKINFLNLY